MCLFIKQTWFIILGNSHLSISKTATKRSLNQPTYGFSSTFSKFKYLRKSLVSKRSKSKTLLKGTKSTNPFVYQKSALKTTVTLIHPYRFDVIFFLFFRLCVKRAININRRFVRQICPDYVKTGFCESGDICPLRHDPKYLRICSKFVFIVVVILILFLFRFLQNACLLGENKCPLAHIMDPCRIPQCAYFAKGACSRCCCNFLHIKYPEGTPFCPDFLVGRCEKWSTVRFNCLKVEFLVIYIFLCLLIIFSAKNVIYGEVNWTPVRSKYPPPHL